MPAGRKKNATSNDTTNSQDNTTTDTENVAVNETVPQQFLESGLVGQTQWFKIKRCFGLIRVLSEGEYKGKDIFVHMSNINSDGFKYLATGEVVQFDLMPSDQEDHEYYAANVNSVYGAKLVCDLKTEKRSENEEYWNTVNNNGRRNDGRRNDGRNDERRNDGRRGGRGGRGRGGGRGNNSSTSNRV